MKGNLPKKHTNTNNITSNDQIVDEILSQVKQLKINNLNIQAIANKDLKVREMVCIFDFLILDIRCNKQHSRYRFGYYEIAQ